MKATLNYLPIAKQQELHTVVQLIRQHAEVEMIILFGSYARDDWVEEYADDGIHFQYQSDFDLLVLVKKASITEQGRLEGKLLVETTEMPDIHTPISVIVHDIDFINRRLERAQYFFSDIKKEGVVLYDSGQLELKEPRELSNKERYQLAKEDFDHWFYSANILMKDFGLLFRDGSYNNAAFLLHQVTERLYSTLLLVLTRYKPNTHSLRELRQLTNTLDRRLVKIFSLCIKEERDRFMLLHKAYIDARYKKNYTITADELTWLAQKVKELEQLTEILCQEKMQGFLVEVRNKN